MTKHSEILEQLVIECTSALFSHYEVSLSHARGASADEIWEEQLALAGIIGFTSDELRGSLVLSMGNKPLQAVESEAAHHRDWIQELSNQVLGRIKNRLLPYGINLKMTTPLSLRGLHLTLEASSTDAKPLLFQTPDAGAVCVLFDGELKPGFELTKHETEENACPDEGELLLF